MNELDYIINTLKELKPELQHKYYIEEIGIFGSYARNEQTADSDIDILIDCKEEVTLFTLGGLQYTLSEIFNKKIDLALKKSLKKQIGKQILAEVIYV